MTSTKHVVRRATALPPARVRHAPDEAHAPDEGAETALAGSATKDPLVPLTRSGAERERRILEATPRFPATFAEDLSALPALLIRCSSPRCYLDTSSKLSLPRRGTTPPSPLKLSIRLGTTIERPVFVRQGATVERLVFLRQEPIAKRRWPCAGSPIQFVPQVSAGQGSWTAAAITRAGCRRRRHWRNQGTRRLDDPLATFRTG